MVYLTISTGVGGGIVIDGRLYRGASGNGGELGHVTVDCDGRPCRGCGRAAVSRPTSPGRRSPSGRRGGHGRRDGGRRRRGGEGRRPDRAGVWDETIEALACGLTSIVNLFEPELVVLGGGVVGGRASSCSGRSAGASAPSRCAPRRRGVRSWRRRSAARVGVVGAAAIAFERDRVGRPARAWLSRAATRSPSTSRSPPASRSCCRAWTRSRRPRDRGARRRRARLHVRQRRQLGRREPLRGGARRPLPARAAPAAGAVARGRRRRDHVHRNDYSFDEVFERQVRAFVRAGDIVLAFSTSGRSENVVRGLAAAREAGATTVLFGGGDGGPAAEHADHALLVPSDIDGADPGAARLLPPPA